MKKAVIACYALIIAAAMSGCNDDNATSSVIKTSTSTQLQIEDSSVTTVDIDLSEFGNKEEDLNALDVKYNDAGIPVKTITGINGIAFDIPKGYTYRESGDTFSVNVNDVKISIEYKRKINASGISQHGANYIINKIPEIYKLAEINKVEVSEKYKVNGISMVDYKISVTRQFVNLKGNINKSDAIEIKGYVHLTVAESKDGIYFLSYISEDRQGGSEDSVLRDITSTIRPNGDASEAWKNSFYVPYLKEKKPGIFEGAIIEKDNWGNDRELIIEYAITDNNNNVKKGTKRVGKDSDKDYMGNIEFTIDVGNCKFIEVTGIAYYEDEHAEKIDLQKYDFSKIKGRVITTEE